MKSNKTDSLKKKSKYFFLQIKPFKDNELGVNHWDTILKNSSSLKSKKISFIVS
jgi:hypothetical protein